MKKIYYYNKKVRAVISQEEIIERLKVGETSRVWHKFNPPSLCDWDSKNLERPDMTTYTYRLNDIPLNPDWETLVEDDLTLNMLDYEELLDHVYDKGTNNLVLKLINNIQRIREFECIGIEFN